MRCLRLRWVVRTDPFSLLVLNCCVAILLPLAGMFWMAVLLAVV